MTVDNQVIETNKLEMDEATTKRNKISDKVIIRRTGMFFHCWKITITSFNFFGFFFYLGSVTFDKEKHENTFFTWDIVFTTIFVMDMVFKFITEK